MFNHSIYHVQGVLILVLRQNLLSGGSSEQIEARKHVEKQASQAKDIYFRRRLPLS